MRIEVLMGGQMGIASGGQDGTVAEDVLNAQQVDAGLQQMRRETVAQAVRVSIFIPQSPTTCLRVFWTPPRSSGELAVAAAFRPPRRLGNSSFG